MANERRAGMSVGAAILMVLVGIFAGAAGCFAVLAWQMPQLEQRLVGQLPTPVSSGVGRTPAATPQPAVPAGGTGGGDSQAIKAAIQRVNPAVVHVTQRRELRDFWGRAIPVETGAGTGFIIDGDKGYVLTNQHVVGEAEEIYVRRKVGEEEEELKARLVSRDVYHDLALLQIEGKDLPEVTWGDSGKLQIGDWVIALGSPYGYEHSASIGIVSALHRYIEEGNRRYEDMIQTDAAINMGNSGGPLINAAGEVVGVNSIISTSSPGGASAGVGFAIPSNLAQKYVADMLREQGGYMGVEIGDRTDAEVRLYRLPSRVQVGYVYPDSPAARAGVKMDDFLVEVDGKKVSSSEEVVRIVREHKAGDKVKLKLYDPRRDEFREVSVTIAER